MHNTSDDEPCQGGSEFKSTKGGTTLYNSPIEEIPFLGKIMCNDKYDVIAELEAFKARILTGDLIIEKGYFDLTYYIPKKPRLTKTEKSKLAEESRLNRPYPDIDTEEQT